MNELSKNYQDYIADKDEYGEIGDFSETEIDRISWSDKKGFYVNMSDKKLALYIIITGNHEKQSNVSHFDNLSPQQQLKVRSLIERYIAYYHKSLIPNIKELELARIRNIQLDISELAPKDIRYEHIKDLDWNEKNQITAEKIVQVFKNAFRANDIQTLELWNTRIMELDTSRAKEIYNSLKKANIPLFEKGLWKEHASEDFKYSELSKYLDDGDVLLFILNRYTELFYNAAQRALPLVDKEASRHKEPFLKARLTMMNLLSRTGKLQEARQVLQMTLDEKPDTLDSYLTSKIVDIEVKLTEAFPALSNTKVTHICRELKKEIKEKYTVQYKEFEAKILQEYSDTYVRDSVELNRRVCFMMALDSQMKISNLREEQKKEREAESKAHGGLGLASFLVKLPKT